MISIGRIMERDAKETMAFAFGEPLNNVQFQLDKVNERLSGLAAIPLDGTDREIRTMHGAIREFFEAQKELMLAIMILSNAAESHNLDTETVSEVQNYLRTILKDKGKTVVLNEGPAVLHTGREWITMRSAVERTLREVGDASDRMTQTMYAVKSMEESRYADLTPGR